jgi:hypothetical protein
VPKKSKTDVISDPSAPSPAAKIDKENLRRRSSRAKPRKGAIAKKSVPSQKAKSTRPVVRVTDPSDHEIRIRAYFISERRRRFDLPGDASSDWLEAKRQLLSETGPR